MSSAEENRPKSAPWFTCFAKAIAQATGRPITFALAAGTILVWAASGPAFHFSDTWQLVINTGTTIVTFLMVFLIQNTQNRDSQAIHVKLDELIRAMKGAKNTLLDLDNLTDEQLEQLHANYVKLAEQAKTKLERDDGRKRNGSRSDANGGSRVAAS
ncbi:MAG TPA: low affinity iron permease family protein [Opitutus sp.]|nr:low affinity iron permease family protein [Opitutus sp.]